MQADCALHPSALARHPAPCWLHSTPVHARRRCICAHGTEGCMFVRCKWAHIARGCRTLPSTLPGWEGDSSFHFVGAAWLWVSAGCSMPPGQPRPVWREHHGARMHALRWQAVSQPRTYSSVNLMHGSPPSCLTCLLSNRYLLCRSFASLTRSPSLSICRGPAAAGVEAFGGLTYIEGASLFARVVNAPTVLAVGVAPSPLPTGTPTVLHSSCRII